MCLILTGCVGNNSNPQQMETTQIPTLVPCLFYAEGSTFEELYSKLDGFSYPMGNKTILHSILFNQQMKSLQQEIYKVSYINWADETTQDTDAIETLDLYFCLDADDGSSSVTEEAMKLNIRIFYKIGVWDEDDFVLDGFETIAEEPVILSGTSADGKTMQFYYFLNKHYVCLLSVETECMEKYDRFVHQLQNLCLSFGQIINEQINFVE